MDQGEFILKNLEIDKDKFGRIFSFVDFGNVNYWFEKYDRSFGGYPLKEKMKGKKIILFYSGHTSRSVLTQADLLINASRIREIICIKKYPG